MTRDEPNTRWRMLCVGKWRPVLSMYDGGNVPTTLPQRAVKAVLYIEQRNGEAGVAVVSCGPAEIFANPAYAVKDWDPVG